MGLPYYTILYHIILCYIMLYSIILQMIKQCCMSGAGIGLYEAWGTQYVGMVLKWLQCRSACYDSDCSTGPLITFKFWKQQFRLSMYGC